MPDYTLDELTLTVQQGQNVQASMSYTVSSEAAADMWNLHGLDVSHLIPTAPAIQTASSTDGLWTPPGAFPVRQDITVLPSDDPERLRLGWVVYEEVGMAVINDYAITQISLDGFNGYDGNAAVPVEPELEPELTVRQRIKWPNTLGRGRKRLLALESL
jgi:hypothetical protein